MLKQLQAGTGLVFAVFVLIHLVNTWLAALGPDAYDGMQSAVRTVYQFPPLEILILASGAVHAIIGIMRMVKEPKRTLSARARWHRYAAIFLLVFIVGHVLAVRGPSWFYDIYPGFAGLAFSIDYVPYYFYPYYFLLGMAGLYHGLNGTGIALARLGVGRVVPDGLLKGSTAGAAILMALALMGLGGVFFDVGPVYETAFAGLAAELFGLEF